MGLTCMCSIGIVMSDSDFHPETTLLSHIYILYMLFHNGKHSMCTNTHAQHGGHVICIAPIIFPNYLIYIDYIGLNLTK